jgi:hypothetical protein
MHTLYPAKPSQSVRTFFPDYGRRSVEKIELRVKGKVPALKSILLKISFETVEKVQILLFIEIHI